jgi:hypothetical protein
MSLLRSSVCHHAACPHGKSEPWMLFARRAGALNGWRRWAAGQPSPPRSINPRPSTGDGPDRVTPTSPPRWPSPSATSRSTSPRVMQSLVDADGHSRCRNRRGPRLIVGVAVQSAQLQRTRRVTLAPAGPDPAVAGTVACGMTSSPLSRRRQTAKRPRNRLPGRASIVAVLRRGRHRVRSGRRTRRSRPTRRRTAPAIQPRPSSVATTAPRLTFLAFSARSVADRMTICASSVFNSALAAVSPA